MSDTSSPVDVRRAARRPLSAAFHAMSVCNARHASRCDLPSSAWSTMTVAITSAGTDPSPRRWPHNTAASKNSRAERDDPCITPLFSIRRHFANRNPPTPELLSAVWAAVATDH